MHFLIKAAMLSAATIGGREGGVRSNGHDLSLRSDQSSVSTVSNVFNVSNHSNIYQTQQSSIQWSGHLSLNQLVSSKETVQLFAKLKIPGIGKKNIRLQKRLIESALALNKYEGMQIRTQWNRVSPQNQEKILKFVNRQLNKEQRDRRTDSHVENCNLDTVRTYISETYGGGVAGSLNRKLNTLETNLQNAQNDAASEVAVENYNREIDRLVEQGLSPEAANQLKFVRNCGEDRTTPAPTQAPTTKAPTPAPSPETPPPPPPVTPAPPPATPAPPPATPAPPPATPAQTTPPNPTETSSTLTNTTPPANPETPRETPTPNPTETSSTVTNTTPPANPETPRETPTPNPTVTSSTVTNTTPPAPPETPGETTPPNPTVTSSTTRQTPTPPPPVTEPTTRQTPTPPPPVTEPTFFNSTVFETTTVAAISTLYNVTVNSTDPSSNGQEGSNMGVVAGVVVGSLLVVAASISFIVVRYRRTPAPTHQQNRETDALEAVTQNPAYSDAEDGDNHYVDSNSKSLVSFGVEVADDGGLYDEVNTSGGGNAVQGGLVTYASAAGTLRRGHALYQNMTIKLDASHIEHIQEVQGSVTYNDGTDVLTLLFITGKRIESADALKSELRKGPQEIVYDIEEEDVAALSASKETLAAALSSNAIYSVPTITEERLQGHYLKIREILNGTDFNAMFDALSLEGEAWQQRHSIAKIGTIHAGRYKNISFVKAHAAPNKYGIAFHCTKYDNTGVIHGECPKTNRQFACMSTLETLAIDRGVVVGESLDDYIDKFKLDRLEESAIRACKLIGVLSVLNFDEISTNSGKSQKGDRFLPAYGTAVVMPKKAKYDECKEIVKNVDGDYVNIQGQVFTQLAYEDYNNDLGDTVPVKIIKGSATELMLSSTSNEAKQFENFTTHNYQIQLLYQEVQTEGVYQAADIQAMGYKVAFYHVQPSHGNAFILKQIETTEWEDMTPAPTNLIRFIVGQMSEIPYWTHCSAGVGRSGVTAIYDRLIRSGKLASWKQGVNLRSPEDVFRTINPKLLDVVKVTRNMRSWFEGAMIIQTWEQLDMLSKLVFDYIYSHSDGTSDA